jgi:TPR repeat protein
MNWTYLGIAALLPLTIALAATLLAGAVQAIRSNRQGGSSRVAFHRLLRTLALVFPLAFLLASLWNGRSTWRGLIGAALGRPADQRAMGLLRSQGEGFLARDPAKAAHWFRKAAERGDARAQFHLARALLTGTGLPKDPALALRWAEAAAQQGDSDAMILAGDLQRPAHPDAADAWYRKAMSSLQIRLAAGNPQACLTYGLLLSSGKGAPRDPIEGLAWMKVAERLGLRGLQALPVRLMEAQQPPAARAEATRRAEALLKTLPPKGKS